MHDVRKVVQWSFAFLLHVTTSEKNSRDYYYIIEIQLAAAVGLCKAR